MDNTGGTLRPIDFDYQQSSTYQNLSNKKILGIIKDMQLGETDLFLFINGFLLPTYEKKYIDYNNRSFDLLDNLKGRDVIFEISAFSPNADSLKNLQLLAKSIKFYDNCNIQQQLLKNESYSNDNKQNLNSALEIINKYPFLILDEPFSNLAKEELFNMINFIRELRRLGKIVLLANRNVQTINKFTTIDRSIKIGRIIKVPCVIIDL